MMTIISGTNRPESNTYKVLEYCAKTATDQGIEVGVLDLQELPSSFLSEGIYGNPSDSFSQILEKKIAPASHIIFIAPEYNGSFPGILKLFLDTAPPNLWKGKKAALIGVATGRSGNQRGLDHLTAVLHYLQMEVYSQKPLLSSIHLHLNEEGRVSNQEYKILIDNQISGFKNF
ncbi:NAD(P)H-dependent oxidoreductase [Cryomorpha ignava]|uniref:NAD(P)H-dependent oxidoreductase n=1 Tax=Cryomorpha ignava TaxID=101383 RepID=A0A7K3WVG6_9FLAO|nr:NAD(P)H-dependent oxidoreductase [Cryomorpha ignava]NEN25486.1 NAD(P)H-dependent oxidoreductase [Cryomorpha ignava]